MGQKASQRREGKRSSWRPLSLKLATLEGGLKRLSGRPQQTDDLSNEIVRYRGISLSALKEVWGDVCAERLVQGVQLYVALDELSDDVAAGRTVQFVSRTGMRNENEFLCRAPYSKQRIVVREEQLRAKPREQWTIEDMCEFVVLPATLADDAFYADTVGPAAFGAPFEGAFVSQARSTPMATLVGALTAHFAGQPADKAFVWIDIFCANQPLLTRTDRGLADGVQSQRWKLLNGGLHDAIARFNGGALILFDSWQHPTPLTRAWCVWELYGAALSGNSLQIIFDDGQAASVEQWLREYDVIGEASFLRLVADMDPRAMQCHDPKDLDMIRGAVEAMDDGFSRLKQMVTERLTRWLLGAVEKCVKRAAQGAHDVAFADLLHNAAMVVKAAGHLDVALGYYSKALAIKKEMVGPRHSSVATTLNNMANVYKAQGRLEQALAMYEEALAICKETLGEQHLSVADTLNNMGLVYQTQGKLKLALDTYGQALAICKETLGEQHSSVAETLNNMAGVYKVQGELDLALDTYEEALAIKKETLGSRHSSVAQTLNNMALVYEAQGKLALALEMYEEALAIKKEAFGPQHSSVAGTLSNMANVYQTQGKLALALDTYEEALAIFKETLGPQHSSVADTLNNMAVVYKVQGKLDLALATDEEALAIKKETLGPRHSSVADTLNNIGEVYQAQGKLDLAQEMYVEALAIYKETLGPRHSDVGMVLSNIGEVHRRQGELEEAEVELAEALSIFLETVGARHEWVADLSFHTAKLYQDQGMTTRALEAAEEAMDIYNEAVYATHPVKLECAALVTRIRSAQ